MFIRRFAMKLLPIEKFVKSNPNLTKLYFNFNNLKLALAYIFREIMEIQVLSSMSDFFNQKFRESNILHAAAKEVTNNKELL